MSTHENLRATLHALGSPMLERPDAWEPQPYKNRREVWGSYVRFWSADQYHMISVHNCSCVLTPSKLVYLIEGIKSIDKCRFGVYVNEKDVQGFYATAKSSRALPGSTNHWLMIARSPERKFSPILRAKSRLLEEEEDVLSYLEAPSTIKPYRFPKISFRGNHSEARLR